MKEVLIVGAGPTGLTLAIELLRRGHSIRLIEQSQGPSTESKALGIHARTLEIFDKMGVIEAFLRNGIKTKQIVISYGGKRSIFRLEGLDSPYPFVLMLPQSKTEEFLLDTVYKHGGKVEWNTQFTGWEGKFPVLKHANGKIERVRSSWIVGCDGAHSQVRRSLAFPFKGSEFSETFLLIDIRATVLTPLLDPHIFLSKKGAFFIIPHTNETIYRLIFPNFSPETQTIDAPFIKQLLMERGMPSIFSSLEPFWISRFKIHRRAVNLMQKENVFLAGDAAHIHSPAGGQGMNISIQDAFNLGWKLDLLLRDNATYALVKSYNSERLPIAQKVLKGTTLLTRVLLLFQKKGAGFFFALLRVLLCFSTVRARLSQNAAGLRMEYRESPIVLQPKQNKSWKGPQPGERAPDVILENGSHLFDAFRTIKHVALFFGKNEVSIESLRTYQQWIEILICEDKKVRKKYAAGKESLYLIRPDGYIGFRSRKAQPEEVFQYLRRLFIFSRDSKL